MPDEPAFTTEALPVISEPFRFFLFSRNNCLTSDLFINDHIVSKIEWIETLQEKLNKGRIIDVNAKNDFDQTALILAVSL